MGPGGYFVRFTACYEYREVARVFRRRFMPQAVLVREQEPLASRVERHLHGLQIQMSLFCFLFSFHCEFSSSRVFLSLGLIGALGFVLYLCF